MKLGRIASVILTAHQPNFMPWLGLFHKISLADRFCIFDDVQYTKKDFLNRNRIKTKNGAIWLTVPVITVNHREIKIKEAKIVNNGWERKHFKTIEQSYSRAPYYSDYINQIEEIFLARTWEYLVDLDFAWLNFGLSAFGIDTEIVMASEYSFVGKKSDLVLDMCTQLGASRYIFGELGKDYAEPEKFHSNGVRIHFQQYQHPIYSQLHGDFLSHLSFIDLLMNEGPTSRNILLSKNLAKESLH